MAAAGCHERPTIGIQQAEYFTDLHCASIPPRSGASNEWKGLPRPELSACAETGNECHDGKCEVSSTHSEGEVMAILNVGIDLAKNVFVRPESRLSLCVTGGVMT